MRKRKLSPPSLNWRTASSPPKKRQATITVKDHKSSFPNTVETRLINPTKAELGRVSKQKQDKVLTELSRATGLSQWRNDLAVVNWFNSLERKENLKFIELDIVQFYPSITKELFTLGRLLCRHP